MPRRYLVLAAVALGYVTIMLAVSPISVALPTIAAHLGIEVGEASWILNAYLLALAACLLPAGRIGDLVGFKPVFLTGVALATLASTLEGFVSFLPAIIALRAVQGVAAALISGTSLAMLTAAFPLEQRGRIVGLATVAAATGAGGGTLLTPAALALFSWQGVFWLVAPVGLASLVLAVRMPPPPQPERANRSIDVPGAVLLAAALLALAASFTHLHEGEETLQAGWQHHVGAQALAVILFTAFVLVERRAREPLVRIEYVRNGAFASAVSANGVYHMTMMATFFLTPFLFERGWGLTAVHSTLVIGVLQGVNLSAALAAGWLVDRLRWPYLSAVALAVIGIAMLTLGVFVDVLDFASYMAVTLIIGIGSGFFNTSNNTTIMSILPGEARGLSSGMLETTRQFGHTVAVSLGALAMGLAGVSLRGSLGPEAMVAGFQVAEVLMGALALAAVYLAVRGRPGSRVSASTSVVTGAPHNVPTVGVAHGAAES